MTVHLVYDTKLNKYRKKEAIVLVNLLSNSRPNDPKLVGRVTFDLGAAAQGVFGEFQQQNLEYCSVNAWVRLRVVLKDVKVTNMEVGDLDKSEFS